MENEKNNNLPEETEKIDITFIVDDMWRGFRRLWPLILALVLIGAAGFYGKTAIGYTPSYQATATFVVSTQSVYGYNESYYNKTTAEQLATTFPYIIQSGALEQVVAKDLGLETVTSSITAESVEDSNLFTIKVTDRDPQTAYNVLESVIENYPSVAEYIIGDTMLTVLDESGVPTLPYNTPDYRSAAAKGAAGGLIIGLAILVLYALTRNTVRREEDLKKHLSITHLGSVPDVRIKSRSDKNRSAVILGGSNSDPLFEESISGIRNRLVHEIGDKKMKTIVVTSTSAEEGKTTMAVNLAVSLAKKKKHVVLIDGDLRNPSVGKKLNLPEGGTNMLELLSEDHPGKMKCHVYNKLPLIVIPGVESDYIEKNGLNEQKVAKVIQSLKQSCDYLIIDTPPCGLVADASVFARCSDGLVLVVRQDYSRMERVLQCVEMLTETGTPILGYVINRAQAGITGYGYGGYGYGYGGYGYGYGSYGYGGYGYGNKKYGYGHYGYGGYGYGYGAGENEDTEAGISRKNAKKTEPAKAKEETGNAVSQQQSAGHHHHHHHHSDETTLSSTVAEVSSLSEEEQHT